jgi:hypothetical protein
MSDRDYSFYIVDISKAINGSIKENAANKNVLNFLNQLVLEIQ